MRLIPLFSLAFILLVLNFLFRKALDQISIRNVVLEYLKRYLPVIEMVCWSLFTAWFLNSIFKTTQYETYLNYLVIVLTAAFLSWFFIKDFIAGVQVKSRFNLIKGQQFQYGKLKGEVKKLGLLTLNIKDENGSDTILPYAKIDQKSIKLNISDDGERESRFVIELDKNLNEQDTSEKLIELVINSAWASHKSLPIVQMIGEEEDIKKYEITYKPIGSEGSKKLKSLIQQSMKK